MAYTLEQIKEKLYKTHTDKIVILEYRGMREKSPFLCMVCGNKWEVETYSIVTAGNGCPVCRDKIASERNRHGFDHVNTFIESKNCKLLSTEYINNRKKLKIEFECGHIGYMCLTSFQNGSRCRKCGITRNNLSKRIPDKIFSLLESLKFKFISFPDNYINRASTIEFICQSGHTCICKIREFLKNKNCQECTKIKMSKSQKGSLGNNWKGGKVYLSSNIKPKMVEWKKKSMESCNYKCVITGGRFDEIHHLYSFSTILSESLNNLGIKRHLRNSDYTPNELFLITEECKNLHERYPLGVCLRKDIHTLFHKTYGTENNTPDQFYEFVDRIRSGEIEIE